MNARSLAALAGLTVLLWVVPSIGTQGMGTVGQQVVHPDATLIDTSASHDSARAVLATADAAAEDALRL